MNPIRHYRNITFRRLALDAAQYIRAQRPVVGLVGPQFKRSPFLIEIDITYKCNLKCANCNRSCTQAPSDAEMGLDRIETFIKESTESGAQWERIRILGGEPTLHSRIFDIVAALREYRRRYNPNARIVLCTNGFGRRVRSVLSKLPGDIVIKSALKASRNTLFRPFNKAPIDTGWHRFSDFSCGCRILEDCGIGLTPSGYYACAVAGGIDRVFRFDMGRQTLPAHTDSMEDQLSVFCRLCGHFGFAWPVKRQVTSLSWKEAYTRSAKRRAHGA